MLHTSQHFLVLLVVPQQTLPVAQQIWGLPVPEHVAAQCGGERGGMVDGSCCTHAVWQTLSPSRLLPNDQNQADQAASKAKSSWSMQATLRSARHHHTLTWALPVRAALAVERVPPTCSTAEAGVRKQLRQSMKDLVHHLCCTNRLQCHIGPHTAASTSPCAWLEVSIGCSRLILPARNHHRRTLQA